jgi:glycerol kinase
VAERAGTSTTALVERALDIDASALPLFLNGVGGLAAPYWRSDFVSRLIDAPPEAHPHALALETLAVLESIAFLVTVNVERADAHLGAARRIVATGGLAQVDWLCQALADVSRREVLRPHASEATARGLAWLTAGRPARWPAAQIERDFVPADDGARRQRFRRWRQEMDAACATPTGSG